MSPKNSLTISLAESVVFRTNTSSKGRRPDDASPPSLLRGLLILDLCKPTRISSIELELTGKATNSWPQYVGSRRVIITDEHEIFNTSAVFFRAQSSNKGTADGWNEFREGLYTYPISFVIPGNAPPTLECPQGHVRWQLNGQVHRPGTFAYKLTASREVILVASPGEDDTEDMENTIIQRQWDSQLQYLLSISGRSFYIGGTLPIQIIILPMTNIKVHRIAVILEEQTDYCTTSDSNRRIARTDPVRRFSLLSLKLDSKEGGPILPIISDDPEAFKLSPFYEMVTTEGDPSGAASGLLGPGPWTLQRELALPTSCTQMHFSNQNQSANILITHTLQVVFRVERGDDQFMDQTTGGRKLFDIVIKIPVNILSCRCTPEWTSLPRYNKLFDGDSAATPPSCPCIAKSISSVGKRELHARGLFNRLPTWSPIDLFNMRRGDSLYDLNTQFERLVSGQESEYGDAPPAYDTVGRSTAMC